MVTSTTSFWWWVLIALWQFITKGGVHIDGDRGRFFVVLEFWSFRLYLGASLCTYFLAHEVFILTSFFIIYELYMIGGDIIVLFLFLVSHCATLIIDLYLWGYSWYMSFILCYVKSRIYFVFHTCVYVFVKCYRNIQVDSTVL